MQMFRGAVAAAVVIGGVTSGAVAAAAAQQATPTQLPAQAQPGVPPAPVTQAPPVPTAPPAAPGAGQLPVTAAPMSLTPACPAPVPPAVAPARAFTAPTGLLLHQVAPTRALDFERFLNYVRDAMAKSTNPTLRRQDDGWKFYRVSDVGPNGDVLYAFLLDPVVPCVDYALAPILAEAYPDSAQLGEIWNLYKTSTRSGGTIMNLVPLAAAPPTAIVTPPLTPVAPAGTQKP